ncbi:MAG: hypothetical protein IIU14_03105 [Ruminococcus sp.]|jgi:hypothetical protein|nr:hypothetical protein [Ruminococcus sp.]
MKKLFVLFICIAVACLLSSCVSGGAVAVNAPSENSQSEGKNDNKNDNSISATGASADSFVLGKIVTASQNNPFRLDGLRLDGDRILESKNGLEISTEGIRSRFVLDEKISFFVSSNLDELNEEVRVLCLEHRAAMAYSEMTVQDIKEASAFDERLSPAQFSVPNAAATVPSAKFRAGDYDIVFMCDSEIAYIVVTHFDES